MSTVGIKETKEALIGLNEAGVLMCERFRDGVQGEDFEAFWERMNNDEEFKGKMKAAYENAKAIPAEIKDIDWMEGGELAMVQVSYVPKYIAAFKKEVAVG